MQGDAVQGDAVHGDAVHGGRATGRAEQSRLRGLLVGVAIVAFYLGGCVISVSVVPLLLVRYRERTRRQLACQRWVRLSWRLFWAALRTLRLVEFDPRRVAAPVLRPPFVLVANHPTLLDIVAIGAVIESGCIVVRRQTFVNPFVAPLLVACGHIGLRRGRIAGSRAVVDAMVERLGRGMAVIVFPEGTRSPAGGLHPFARGAFHAARMAGVPVVPAFVEVDPPMLDHEHPWFSFPRRAVSYRLRFGEPIRPGVDEDVRSLTARVEGLFGTVRR